MTAVELGGLTRDAVSLSDEECPGISVHPGRALLNRERLIWQAQPRGPYRVVEHTCCCQAVFYELICVGGIYQVHKVIQSDPPRHGYVGGWRSREARQWWLRILLGSAR
ncbi:hypothetical protein Misp02_71130 [Microtetraspora sp. NBRC 16547]|nr:hypothetical protein Misp02_71130 [Microtetraspora sp. NBRC 16547]